MRSTVSSCNDQLTEAATTLGHKVAETVTQSKHRLNELGRKTADKIDENLSCAADGLDKAAATLHDKAEHLPGVDAVSGLTHATANKLSATAEYVRDHDVNTVRSGLATLVRNNWGSTLLVAGIAGFLLGRALSSSNNSHR